MPANRTFDFPVSTLIRDSKRLLGALRDTVTGPPVAKRLKVKNPTPGQPDLEFDPGFDARIKLVEKGGTDQSTAVGGIGEMTSSKPPPLPNSSASWPARAAAPP